MGGHDWGATSDEALTDAVHIAIEAGVNFFDTADVYGLGKSEALLGSALGRQREKAVIATKFGVRIENGKTFYDNSPSWIENACAASLRRLRTDTIDLYQLHYRDGITPVGKTVEVLERLRTRGWIRYFGLSNVSSSDISDLQGYANCFVSFQDEFSLVCRRNEQCIRLLADKLHMTPMTWGSLGQGILSGKYDENSVFGPDDRRSREVYQNFHGDALRENMRILKRMEAFSANTGHALPSIAIRWILDKLPRSVAITGIKNRQQLKSNASALDWRLSPQDVAYLANGSDGGNV